MNLSCDDSITKSNSTPSISEVFLQNLADGAGTEDSQFTVLFSQLSIDHPAVEPGMGVFIHDRLHSIDMGCRDLGLPASRLDVEDPIAAFLRLQ